MDDLHQFLGRGAGGWRTETEEAEPAEVVADKAWSKCCPLLDSVCVVQAELREEQQTYRQYLSDELQKQKREEEETEQLTEEKLKEVWTKREEQSRLQREARNRLMEEVMEARSLQIQHKRKKTECL